MLRVLDIGDSLKDNCSIGEGGTDLNWKCSRFSLGTSVNPGRLFEGSRWLWWRLCGGGICGLNTSPVGGREAGIGAPERKINYEFTIGF